MIMETSQKAKRSNVKINIMDFLIILHVFYRQLLIKINFSKLFAIQNDHPMPISAEMIKSDMIF